jgi:acyl dehydratase
MVDGFAEVIGDKNPIHMDEEYALKTPFKRCIAHGMLNGGLISSILANDMPGPGTIYLSQSMNFMAPVFIGDVVKISVVVKHLKEGKPIATLETTASVQGKIVVNGEAVVKFAVD